MIDLSFFTTFQIGWLNAWIPAFAMVLTQLVYMAIYKEGGKRAADISWYTAKDKLNGGMSTLLQIVLLILSLFVPLLVRSFKSGCNMVLDWSGNLCLGFHSLCVIVCFIR